MELCGTAIFISPQLPLSFLLLRMEKNAKLEVPVTPYNLIFTIQCNYQRFQMLWKSLRKYLVGSVFVFQCRMSKRKNGISVELLPTPF